MTPEFLVLALEFYRRPLHYRYLLDPHAALPVSFDALVSDLGGAMVPSRVRDTASALACTPEELQSAVQFTVREVLLRPNASHYRVLGLTHDADAERISQHYHILVRLFHPDLQPEEERIRSAEETARINAAYRVLRHSNSRLDYDRTIRKRSWVQRPRRRTANGRSAPPTELIAAQVKRSTRNLRQWATVGTVGIAVLVGAIWSALADRPTLRITATGEPTREIKPAFLSSAPRTEKAQVPAHGETRASDIHLAQAPAPDSSAGPTTTSPTTEYGAASPTLVLEHLERHVRGGDLDAMLRLLSDDARITNADARDQRGVADLFQSTLEKQLRISQFRLTQIDEQHFRADGRLTLTRAGGAVHQSQDNAVSGRILLEIVHEDSAYRISAVDYKID